MVEELLGTRKERLAELSLVVSRLVLRAEAVEGMHPQQANLLEEICKACHNAGYPKPWVSTAVQDQHSSIRMLAQYGWEEKDFRRPGISWADCRTGQGPVSRAIRLEKVEVSRGAELAEAVLAIPLVIDDECVGAFTLLSKCNDAFAEWEVTRLQALVCDVSCGLSALRRRQSDRLVQQGLRDTCHHLGAAVSGSPVGLFQCDRNGFVLWGNKRTYEMTGLDPASELGCIFTPASPDAEGFRGRWLACIEEGTAFEAVVHYHSRSRLAPIRLLISSKSDSEVNPSYWGSVTDYSAQHELEVQLAATTTAIRFADAAIVTTDVDGSIESVNPAFERQSGYSAVEAIGRNPRILKSGKMESRYYSELWKTILAGNEWTGRLINKRSDGELYTVDQTIAPITSPTAGLLGFVSVEVERSTEVELQNQLGQSEKMQSVGMLAAGVAHDFNNLLTIIFGAADMLESELADTDLREDVESLQEAATRATGLTRQLLACSSPQVAEPRVLSLNGTIEEMRKMLGRVIREDYDVTTKLAPDLHKCRIDPGQLEQILLNLAVNARDAMKPGDSLCFETRNTDRGDRLGVSDTGSGMDEEVRSKIFDPLFTTKSAERSTGLGLSTVFTIVSQAGGEIAVTSSPGVGTTFEIFLPQAEQETIIEAPDSLAPGPRDEKVLLVEDDPSIRRLLSKFLSGEGFTIIQAANGRLACEMAEQGLEVDLLITDLVMPGATGREVATEYRKRHPDTKILFMTGYSDEELFGEQGLESERLLRKPFNLATLIDKVDDVLRTQAP